MYRIKRERERGRQCCDMKCMCCTNVYGFDCYSNCLVACKNECKLIAAMPREYKMDNCVKEHRKANSLKILKNYWHSTVLPYLPATLLSSTLSFRTVSFVSQTVAVITFSARIIKFIFSMEYIIQNVLNIFVQLVFTLVLFYLYLHVLINVKILN